MDGGEGTGVDGADARGRPDGGRLGGGNQTRSARPALPFPLPLTLPLPRPLALPRISLDERFGRLLLSVLLAILLWFYVTSLENPERQTIFRNLPVAVRGLSSDLRIINADQLPTVDAIVQAPENLMGNIRQSDIHPYIDLSGLDAGVRIVPVQVDRAGLPDGVSITLRPDKVQVQLEVQVSREFPVTVKITGTPAFGYGLEPAQVDPDRVRVTGSRDAVASISEVVVPVDVDQKAGTQQGLVEPVALDASGKKVEGVSFSPDHVQVVVPVRLLFSYKVVPVTVPILGQPAPGYIVSRVTFTPTTVTVCCSPSLLEPLGSLETRPVSITGTTSAVITTTEIVLPAGVELYPGQNRTVNVSVNVEPQLTTWQLSVPVVLEGVPPGMSAVASPNRLDLTLAGTFVDLQALKPTDVRASINLQGRDPGTYDLQPQITLPSGITLTAVTPERVTVTIIAPTPTRTTVPPASPTPVPTGLPGGGTGATPTATAVPTRSPTPQTATPALTVAPPLTPTPQPATPPAIATPTATP